MRCYCGWNKDDSKLRVAYFRICPCPQPDPGICEWDTYEEWTPCCNTFGQLGCYRMHLSKCRIRQLRFDVQFPSTICSQETLVLFLISVRIIIQVSILPCMGRVSYWRGLYIWVPSHFWDWRSSWLLSINGQTSALDIRRQWITQQRLTPKSSYWVVGTEGFV